MHKPLPLPTSRTVPPCHTSPTGPSCFSAPPHISALGNSLTAYRLVSNLGSVSGLKACHAMPTLLPRAPQHDPWRDELSSWNLQSESWFLLFFFPAPPRTTREKNVHTKEKLIWRNNLIIEFVHSRDKSKISSHLSPIMIETILPLPFASHLVSLPHSLVLGVWGTNAEGEISQDAVRYGLTRFLTRLRGSCLQEQSVKRSKTGSTRSLPHDSGSKET